MPNPPVEVTELSDVILQVRVQWTYSHVSYGESSWSFRMPTSMPDPQQVVADGFMADLMPFFSAFRPRTWVVNTVRVEDRFPQTRAPLIIVPDPEIAGDPDQPGTSPAVGPLISWRTDNEGRSYRGRTYWGPIQRKDTSEEDWLGDADDAVFPFAEAMIGIYGPIASPLEPWFVILSRQHDGVPGPPFFYTRVTTYLCNNNVATMRRRNKVWSNIPY